MRRLGKFTGVVGLMGVSSLACSHDSNETGSFRQALVGGTTCNVGQPCALAMQFPSGVNPDQLAVVGLDGVSVGGGSRVLGRNGQSGALIADSGPIQLQASAQVGSIWTKGSAFVGSGAIVSGELVANAQSVVQAGAVVPPRTAATGSLASLSWDVTFPASSQGNINIEPDRTLAKAPGRYGDLRVASRSTLKLSTGTYYFDSLQTDPDATIEVDNAAGTALIYVRGTLVHRGSLVSKGAASDLLIGSFSNGTIEIGDQFDGTLVAPSALIRVAQARNGGVHDGMFFGKQVELQGSVKLSAAPVSNTGPAIGGMKPTFVPDPNAPSPGPVPTPAGKTYEEYTAAKNAYIQQLLDDGYLGETKQLEVHPDAAKENQLSDFSLPSSSVPAVAPPHVIPPRNPALHQPGQPAQDAVDEFRAEMAEAEEAAGERYEALAQPDSTNQPGAEYGTELTPPEIVPETCLFSQKPPPPPTIDPNTNTAIASLDDFVIGPLVPDIVLGNRPDYLKFGAPGEGYEPIDDKLPNFDGYWFFAGRLHGGWNGVGMEGMAEATVQAGGVLLKHHIELVRVAAFADGAILKQVDGEVKPYFASSLETKFLGKKIESASWAASTNDPALAKLKRTLLNESRTLFEGTTPPTLQVGPFGLSLDGGAEVKVTLALNLDPNGPELTLSPTFRVYLTIFAGINLGIQIGVEGEADVVKVDMPFTAKLKWMDHLTPETCYSSADFAVTFKTVWSTLNGKLYVTVRVKNPFPVGPDRIDIVREQITDWDGPTFDSGEVSLIPNVEIPLIHQDPNECLLGAQDCAVKAEPNRTAGIGQAFTVDVPYGQAACPSQYVYEVPASTNTTNMWIRNQWQITDMDTEAECNDAKVRVDVWRLLADGTTWTGWDSYQVKGVWQQGVGCQTSFEGGKLPGGETNGTLGFPWSWVDTGSGVQKVRVAVGGGTACNPRPLSIGILDAPPI